VAVSRTLTAFVYCVSTAGTSNSALLVPRTSATFVHCILTAGIGDAGLARLREDRLPNQNASPVSAIAPTAPIAAPAIQACGPLLPVVVIAVGIVAPEDVEELDKVVGEIGEAFEEVAAALGATKTNKVETDELGKEAEDALDEREKLGAEVDELAEAVIIRGEGVIVNLEGLEGLERLDVAIATVGRLWYSVVSGPPCPHLKSIVEGPSAGDVWYIVMVTHPTLNGPLYHYLLVKYASYLGR
jgi:hypothetical protein